MTLRTAMHGVFARAVAACLLLGPAAFATPPAFPGAVGQGAAATGGRGGDVYVVTTLEDYHPRGGEKIEGSLRHALRSITGPRTIVFDVAGAIALKAPLEVYKSHVTIAGQTSPGGITLWGYPFEVSNDATDVVIRHLRVRLGDFHARQAGPARPGEGSRNRNADLDAASANAVYVGDGAERVVLDHVSASWGMDETLSVTNARDVTIQHCIIAEALRDSLHPKGPHGYGSLVRGLVTPEDQDRGAGGYTFYGCLWAHNDARNPSFGGEQKLDAGRSEDQRLRTDLNLLNSVVYDWGNQAAHRSELGDVRVNLIGNCFINGPAKNAKYYFRGTDAGHTEVYHAGNLHDRELDGRLAGEPAPSKGGPSFDKMNPDDVVRSEGPPLNFLGPLEAKLVSAERAYRGVLAVAGASLWRDAVDRRIVASVRGQQGQILDSQEATRLASGVLPGIDDLETISRPAGFDTDRDGMPNAFELSHGLNPDDPSDGNGTGLSEEGYTNLEVYLAEAASPRRVGASR